MGDTNKGDDRSSWAIGGGVLIGIGVGFFFLQKSVSGIEVTIGNYLLLKKSEH